MERCVAHSIIVGIGIIFIMQNAPGLAPVRPCNGLVVKVTGVRPIELVPVIARFMRACPVFVLDALIVQIHQFAAENAVVFKICF